MFAVHAPQTIAIKHPDDEDGPGIQINLKQHDHDSSRCVLEVIIPEEGTYTYEFATRGRLINMTAALDVDKVDEEDEPKVIPPPVAGAPDPRAFNPYTYQAPVTDEQRSRDGMSPGYTGGGVPHDEHMDRLREARDEAASRAEEAYEEIKRRQDETPEERAEREKAERDAAFEAVAAEGRKDVPNTTVETFPNEATRKGAEKAPPPSSPLPGSPPDHALDDLGAMHGKVNTTESMTDGDRPLAENTGRGVNGGPIEDDRTNPQPNEEPYDPDAPMGKKHKEPA